MALPHLPCHLYCYRKKEEGTIVSRIEAMPPGRQEHGGDGWGEGYSLIAHSVWLRRSCAAHNKHHKNGHGDKKDNYWSICNKFLLTS